MSEQADRDALAEVLGEHSWDMTDQSSTIPGLTWESASRYAAKKIDEARP